MALIIEDGSGVANANSYVTVEEYRDYAEPRGIALPVSDTTVETQLILAMDYMEVQCWKGIAAYDDQSLAFPRDDVYIGGNLIANDTIPGKLKLAQMQLAIQVNAGVDLMPVVVGGASGAVIREKVGPLETEYASPSVGTQPYFRSINALLAPYLCGLGFGQFRATRG